MRADLQSKQSELQLQIAVVKSQYMGLTPNQRVALAAPAPVPPPGPPCPAPTCSRCRRPTCSPPRRRAACRPGDIAPPEAAVTRSRWHR